MTRTDCEFSRLKRVLPLLMTFALAIGCVGVTCTGCSNTAGSTAQQTSTTTASSSNSSSSSTTSQIAQQLSAIEGVTSVTPYTNETIETMGLNQAYDSIYEITFTQPIDHNNASAGTFEQHVRLFYAGPDAVSVVNTDGYMLFDYPSTAYNKFLNEDFTGRYGIPNIVQVEYRFFGNSKPEGLDESGTGLWNYLTMDQAATDFHEIVQKLSNVLSGKRLWTGTSKGGLTTDYQCYYQEQHGYNDADAFVAFCAPFCDGRNDSRLMDAVYGNIGYAAYGEEQASAWHDLVDRFQVACIKHREELQTKYYQQAVEAGSKFREDYFGTDAQTQAERVWDVTVNEFSMLGFWQYYQDKMVDPMTQAINSDSADDLYNCVLSVNSLNPLAYNNGFVPYAIQATSEMGDYTESFDHLRELIAAAKESAPEAEKSAYYLAIEENTPSTVAALTNEQIASLTYSSATRDAMIKWFNSTSTAHLIMVSGQSDPWYFVRPELTFSNSQIKCFESTYNHTTTIENLSESDQASVWATLDGWLK